MTEMNTIKELLSKKELAASLGVSMSTVDRGIRDNISPYNLGIRIGKRIRFSPDKIEKAIEEAFTLKEKKVREKTKTARGCKDTPASPGLEKRPPLLPTTRQG
jgi:predicted DNA-binding transcriptional regulator AlpA